MKKLCFDKYSLSKDQFLLPLIRKLLRFAQGTCGTFISGTCEGIVSIGLLKALNKCFKGSKVTPVQRTDSITHTEDLFRSVIR